MSETVLYTGKLTKLVGVPEELAEAIMRKNGFTEPTGGWDTWLESLREEMYDDYVEVKGELYSIYSEKEEEGSDVLHAHRNPDGSIEFIVQFYNGSCGLSEALESAVGTLTEKESKKWVKSILS